MRLKLVLIYFLTYSGHFIHLNSGSVHQELLSGLLQLHKNHCGDVAVCDNETGHLEPSFFVIPVPCCVPCSCLSTCMQQQNCCPVIQNHTDVNTTAVGSGVTAMDKQTRTHMKNGSEKPVVDMETGKDHPTGKMVSFGSHAETEQAGMLTQDVLQEEQILSQEKLRDFKDILLPNNSRSGQEKASMTVETVCVRPQFLRNINQFLDAKAYRMVAACNNGLQNTTINDKCHARTEDTTLLDRIPVTSKTSGVSYMNKYCLLCNENDITDANISVWQVAIVAYSKVYTYTFLPSLMSLIKRIEEFETGSRNIHFLPRKKYPATECDTYDITTCNQTGLWKTHDEMIDIICHYGPALPVIHHAHGGRFLFKNIACVHCNTATDFNNTELRCGYYDHTLSQGLKLYSMTLNLDSEESLRLQYINENVLTQLKLKTGRCSPEYFDIMGRCRTVVCPRDHYTSGNQCIPLYDVLNGLDLNINIQITPDQNIPRDFSTGFVDKLKKMANDSLMSVVSLKIGQMSLWHLPVSKKNPREYFLFNVFFFNTTGQIKYSPALVEILNFYNRLKSHETLTLSSGGRVGLSFAFSNRIQSFRDVLYDTSTKTGGRLLSLMVKGWAPKITGPYMTISNVNWCYRTHVDATMISRNEYSLKDADMIVHKEEVDFCSKDEVSAASILCACIDLFIDTSAKQSQPTNWMNWEKRDREIRDLYTIPKISTKVSIIVISVLGGLIFIILLYKVRGNINESSVQSNSLFLSNQSGHQTDLTG